MKKLHDKLIFFIPLLTCCFFISCSKKDDQKKITLTVLNYLDSKDPNSANDVSAVWDKFEKENPNILIVREDYFGNEFHEKVTNYLANGTLPDVINMWPGGRSSAIHTAHAVKDLRPFLKADDLINSYSAAALQNQYAGYLAELPDAITYTNVLFVNKKLLQENNLSIPQTYEDFFTIEKTLSPKGIQTILIDNKQSWVMQSLLFSLVVGRFGGMNWNERIMDGSSRFSDDWFVKSLAIIDELCRNNVISKETLSYDYGDSQNLFAEGKGAFFIGGDWKTATFQTDRSTGQGLISKEAQQNDFELMSMPPFKDEVIHNSDSGTVGTGWAINATIPQGSAKEKAAWKLIQYLEGPYVQTYRLTIGKAFPTLQTLDVDQIAKENNLEPFTTKRAALYKKYPNMTPVIDNVFPEQIYAVINNELHLLIEGKTTPRNASITIQVAWNEYTDQ